MMTIPNPILSQIPSLTMIYNKISKQVDVMLNNNTFIIDFVTMIVVMIVIFIFY